MLPSNRRERNTLCHRVMPGRRSGDCPIMRAKRPPGNIQRPAGLKIARFRKRPFRPGHTRLASTSEQGESKLLFRPRNKRIVAARTHGPRLFVPFQLPLPPMRILSVGELADVVPVERPHDSDARQHRGAAAGRDQDQGFHRVLPLRRARPWEAPARAPEAFPHYPTIVRKRAAWSSKFDQEKADQRCATDQSAL
jgi:hypothetical protein